MHKPILDYLNRYIHLTSEEETYFVSILKHRKYLKRQFVVQAGDDCKYETYLVKGCLRAYFIDPNRNSHIIQFTIEDWWVSDMASLMTGEPATFNMTPSKKQTLFKLNARTLTDCLIKYPSLTRCIE